ncbi:MAG: hypothetical protein ACK587_13910 [Cyanobacteriota bacterium]
MDHPAGTLHHVADQVLVILDRLASRLGKLWPIFVLLLAIGISFFFSPPYYPLVSEFLQQPFGQAKTWWLQHPFQSVPVESFFPSADLHIGFNAGMASHLDKLTFRAFLPLVHQLFPFGLWTLVAASHLAGIAIFFLSFLVVARHTQDRVVAALTTWSVAACFAGQYGFLDYRFGDVVAVSLLLGALCSRHKPLVSLLVFFSCLTDERILFLIPLSLIFHWTSVQTLFPSGQNLPRSLVAAMTAVVREGWPILSGLILYLLLRITLAFTANIHTGTSGLFDSALFYQRVFSDYPLRFFTVFEFLWLPLLIFSVNFCFVGRPLFRLFVCTLILAVFPALVVWDLDRSLFYLLPAIIYSVALLPVSLQARRLLMLAIVSANLAWFSAAHSVLEILR